MAEPCFKGGVTGITNREFISPTKREYPRFFESPVRKSGRNMSTNLLSFKELQKMWVRVSLAGEGPGVRSVAAGPPFLSFSF